MKQLRDYQSNILNDIKADIDAGVERIVMAMCPNSGKTFTSIKLMEDLLSSGTSKKILVLAHGTTVLRSQFYDSLETEKPSFTYKQITPQARSTKAQVLVALPQGLNNVDLSEVDTVLVDEAHERYLAADSQRLMKKINPKRTILLTGTPSKFIYENHKKPGRFKIHMVAMSDIDNKYMANTQVYVCSSKYSIKEEDYNQNEEVRSVYNFKKKDTEGTIDLFLEEMYKLLKMKYITAADNFVKMSFSKLHKTMVACKSQAQARQVYDYLIKNGVNALVSTEDTDLKSDNIKTFVENPEVKVLVVVNRGILGFNLPSLVNVVDMSGTRNLDRMYQLFSRVTRTDKDIKYKRYFKIAPVEEVEYMQYVTQGMLALIHRDNISRYNGKNFKTDIPILVKREKRKSDGKSKGKSKSKSAPKLMEFEGLDVTDVFTKVYSNLDKTLQVYSKSSLGEVRKALGKQTHGNKYWTKERCRNEALKYKTKIEWSNKSSSSYSTAKRMGWIEEMTQHMNKSPGDYTFEECLLESQKFNTRAQWQKTSRRTYDKARKEGWVEECAAHMRLSKYRGNKSIKCKEIGKYYSSIKEASDDLDINREMISRVLIGKRKSTHGYTFEYVKESDDEQ